MSTKTVFSEADIGCYADSGAGMDHVHDVLAGLVEEFDAGKADELRPEADPDGEFVHEVADEAIDILNEHCEGLLSFKFQDGDLILSRDDGGES